jgi:1-acyl-sn-glycerol-3-phosphate acyltransferase
VTLPPRWFRRLVIDPGLVVGLVFAFLALPLWLVGGLVAAAILPGTFRILRISWFLFLYLAVEVVTLISLFVLWVASGFGWKVQSDGFRRAHFRLLGLVLHVVVGSAKRAFNLSVELQDPPAQTVGTPDRRPALMLSRHAGPGDSMLLLHYLVNGYRREPRIVLKEFLQWDPMVDVMLNRLPVAFVPGGRKGGERLLEAIAELAAGMGKDDAFVIFPEGANFSKGRQLRAIRKLHDIGRPDLAERAEALRHTLPPRTTGVQAVLAAAPANADVFFVGHAGLEAFESGGDIWRGMPMDTIVAARTWIVAAEDIPPTSEQEPWLYETWAEIDGWIVDTLAETAEPA